MGACTSPIPAWRRATPDAEGKTPLIFNGKDPEAGEELELPCGQCMNCRLNKSRDWAVRCVHEAQMHEEEGNKSSFITLTYDDEHLETMSLEPEHWTKFLKRLREKIRDVQPDLRFFMAGEYGTACKICGKSEIDCRTYSKGHEFDEGLGRPHFHALLFGYDFPDKEIWRTSQEHEIYRSQLLEDTWTYGHSEIGSVSFNSASYVARYITKKITGEQSTEHYSYFNSYSGDIDYRLPEYCRQSRGRGDRARSDLTRYGIGSSWFAKYYRDTHDDVCHIEGKPHPVPEYYDSILERIDYDEYCRRKDRRRTEGLKKEWETPDRRGVRSDLTKHRLNRTTRSLA